MNNSWRRFKPGKFVVPKSWRELFSKIFNIGWIVVIILLLGAGGYFGYRYYLQNTEVVPSDGGTLIEGMAGQPKYMNPILSQTNDVDRDLVHLLFSGLLAFDKNHQLVGDLAEKWELSEDEKTYTVTLKPDLKWHDGQAITSDDVVFTFQTIQHPNYPGMLADNWRDVQIDKVDNRTIKFTLKEVFSPFLVNLTTGIIPQHLLKDINPSKLLEAEFNSKPIGSGQFKLDKLLVDQKGQINSVQLVINDDYYGPKPHLTGITFKFYTDYQTLYRAYQNKEIMSISRILIADWPQVSNTVKNIKNYDISLPQYSAVFINQNTKPLLRDPYLKEALYYGLNRQEIVKQAIFDKGKVINTPILDTFMGHNPNIPAMPYDIEKAKAVLEKGKWSDVDNDGTREKDNVRLSFQLVTSDNPEYALTANLLKKYWKEIGIEVNVKILTIGDLETEFIKPRNYDALLFGENLGSDPDPYVYWHSSQITDPGLNLANYTNIEIDKYLEAGRKSNNADTRIHSYLPFQEVIFDDKPAIFLYQPYYIYGVNQAVQNVNVTNASNPADRFSFIQDWYINTKRVWKK